MARALRVVRRAMVVVLGVYLLLIVVLRADTYLFRRQAERLMGDIKALQLDKSSWADAQLLMTRWGRYGSYEGSCTEDFCRYRIDLASPLVRPESVLASWVGESNLQMAVGFVILPLDELGGQGAWVRASFVVQDRIVQRKSGTFEYLTPPTLQFHSEEALIGTARAASRISGPDDWILVGTEQLAQHPYYVVRRPSGCTFCMMANATFAVNTPTEEVNRLLTFDFSCLTRLIPCRYLDDVYPAAEEWNLYGGEWSRSQHEDPVGLPPAKPLACGVPLFARGREVDAIVSVTPLSESQRVADGEVSEQVRVRINDIVKGWPKVKSGDIVNVVGHSDDRYTPLQIEVPLAPGQTFLLLIPIVDEKASALEAERCLVIEDAPAARAELTRHSALSESLKVADPHASDFFPF